MTDQTFQRGPPLPVYSGYKDKLLTKYMKDSKDKRHLSGALDGRRWRFLNADHDDFRDGYPMPAGKETLAQGQRGTSPVIFGISSRTFASDKTAKKRFSKEQACFSKQNPLQQARRQHVAAVEYKLKQHPLALYPHLEQGMAPELFDQVISVLDPDMCINRASTEEEDCVEEGDVDDHPGPCQKTLQESESKEDVRKEPSVSEMQVDMQDNSCPKNPYKRLQTRENNAKEDQMVNDKPSQDEDWVASLGGENNNLTEDTLRGLFVSGYEKKPCRTFPIKVLEPSDVPEELRNSVEDLRREHTYLKDSEPYRSQPGTKRPIYGAWYLDPQTWKRRDADELLRDPNVIPEDFEFPEQPSERDEELKLIYATQAFKQFIVSKGLRVPRFLSWLFEEEERENRPRGGSDAIGSAS